MRGGGGGGAGSKRQSALCVAPFTFLACQSFIGANYEIWNFFVLVY